jgi:DNA invertase Pin-like site-specific DNA recombinase
MRVGYARVSTADQNLDLQRDALRRAGCRRHYEDRASGRDTDRPKLRECLAGLVAGDCLVVWRLDRMPQRVGRHLLANLGFCGGSGDSSTNVLLVAVAAPC